MKIKQINRYKMDEQGSVEEPPEVFHGKSIELCEIPGVDIDEDFIGIIPIREGMEPTMYYEIWFEPQEDTK